MEAMTTASLRGCGNAPGEARTGERVHMLENEPTGGERATNEPAGGAGETSGTTRRVRTVRRRVTKTAVAPETTFEPAPGEQGSVGAPGEQALGEPTPRTTRRRPRSVETEEAAAPVAGVAGEGTPMSPTRKRRKAAAPAVGEPAGEMVRPAISVEVSQPFDARRTARAGEPVEEEKPGGRRRRAPIAATVLFMAPEVPRKAVEPRHEPRTAEPHGGEARGGGTRAERARGGEARDEQARGEVEEPAETGRTTRSRRRIRRGAEAGPAPVAVAAATGEISAAVEEEEEAEAVEAEGEAEYELVGGRRRRRRGRRGRGRGRGTHEELLAEEEQEAEAAAEEEAEPEEEAEAGEPLTRRRRRRRRGAAAAEATETAETAEDGVVTVVKVRQPRAARDEVQGVSGSTRLEAKRQRRRDGREQRRTRPPILSESEFLARREAVERAMVIREQGDRTQIAVLEDGVLVEHYVTRASAGTIVGNVYLGKVQNVLPSMEAAFVDIGRGRNAVLYAGEVNWAASGLEGKARSIEQALKSGDPVLVQVTKDPIGHKGARLTSHIALSGRHLVYVPHGNASGISRKLPDNERRRLRDVLKHLIPEGAGAIVRTAAEGASADELERDVNRLQAQWEDIQAKSVERGAPVLLYEEPDLVIRVVRDLFNEDFRDLVIQGGDAYDTVQMYLKHVSPDLVPRLHRYTGTSDVFAERRIDEQILKGLDRKVYLPSGGSLVIDRTEAMTVIDVNTGKYTGTGGNLEETVTRNNLEAAEEIVRQLRLRDLGGIIVIDFIDMVLESNRELVLRRLTECLGRDRTKHQVTEITSLGLVQMTRKRIGQGLLEAFSETCEHCKGRGVVIHAEPATDHRPPEKQPVAEPVVSGGRRRGRKAAAVPVPGEPEHAVEQPHPGAPTDTGVHAGEEERPEQQGQAGAARREGVSRRARTRRSGRQDRADQFAAQVGEGGEAELVEREELAAENLAAVEDLAAEDLAIEELVAEDLVAEEGEPEDLVDEGVAGEELAVEGLAAEDLLDTIEEDLDSLDAGDGGGGGADAGGGGGPGAGLTPAVPEPLPAPAVLERAVLEPTEPASPVTQERAGQEPAAEHGFGSAPSDPEPADGRANGEAGRSVVPPVGAVGRRQVIWASRRRSRR
jgi:ribonuclease E